MFSDACKIFAEPIAMEESASDTHTVLSSIVEEKDSRSPSEYGTLNESLGPNEAPTSTLSSKEQLMIDAVVHFGHWLTETERDSSLVVDLADSDAIRDANSQLQVS